MGTFETLLKDIHRISVAVELIPWLLGGILAALVFRLYLDCVDDLSH